MMLPICTTFWCSISGGLGVIMFIIVPIAGALGMFKDFDK